MAAEMKRSVDLLMFVEQRSALLTFVEDTLYFYDSSAVTNLRFVALTNA